MSEADKVEDAKKVILTHLDKMLTVKNTRWVYDEEKKEYIEVDAGYTEKDMKLMQDLRYRDMKKYFKLSELLEDLI